MLYPKNSDKALSLSLFKNPTCEYRGTPFWAWNCALDKKELEKQIEHFKEMGLGGFHMHARTGLATDYLSEEFMDAVKACVNKAEKEDMLAWLYDEDRWPSGAAGGLVTKDPAYRARKLLFTVNPEQNVQDKETALKNGGTYLVGSYDIVLNERGELLSCGQIAPGAEPVGQKWYAYSKAAEESPWFNNQTYVDTLSEKAMDKFIEITYEAYKRAVGDRFGKSVPAIFTDEPQFERERGLTFAQDKTDAVFPWTGDLEESYEAATGIALKAVIPELIWELPNGKISKARYLFHNHITDRFARAFADNCGAWCEKNGLMLTGHMMQECTLKDQTESIGEAMRHYRGFHLPGIDILCDRVELTTAKQAQSAARQYGRAGVLSELYGVTNWDFDFRGHKFQGDWQAALGVTVRVPHLSWAQMGGEAKRDYPASIAWQSPWYREYSYVEDHFARLNTALTRGEPVVTVGVIHPIESYWLRFGPKENTASARAQMDENFQNVTQWLLFGQIDFDFISESLLPELNAAASAPLEVGKMKYDAIIVPGCETLRSATVERLKKFREAGGRLIFLGEPPKYMDAEPSPAVKELYDASEKAAFSRTALLGALEKERVLDIRNADATVSQDYLYTMRRDGDCDWLFIARGVKEEAAEFASANDLVLAIKGEYTPEVYDTLTGETKSVGYELKDGRTVIKTALYYNDSLLLRLGSKTLSQSGLSEEKHLPSKVIDFKTKVKYDREEPNVLLLDMAEYSLDGEEFAPMEEVLRLDNALRKRLGYPSRQAAVAQPWTIEKEKIEHTVSLRFTINSAFDVKNPTLALEDAETAKISLNKEAVEPVITGRYVDSAIKTVALPEIKQGKNTLIVTLPFGRRTNTEACYLLGDFDVKVSGCEATLLPPSGEIAFSSIAHQGLAFYGGNLTYQTEIETPDCDVFIRAGNYRGALIRVKADGKDAGVIAYAPCGVWVKNLGAGKHKIEFTLFGNRFNTFAALHHANAAEKYCGPNHWRREGIEWSYEYVLRPMGILASPVIEVFEK